MPGRSEHTSKLDYLDFELEIGVASDQQTYPVAVLRSPAGEARESMRFPFDQLTLDNRLLTLQNALLRSGVPRRRVNSPDEQAVQDFGQTLFESLFVGEIRSRYDLSVRFAEDRGKGVRLKLRIQSPELASLPWELLYDPRHGEYICLSRSTPIVRYLEQPQSMPPLHVKPPLRILGLVASPRDLAPLDITEEQKRVETAIAGLQARGIVELTWMEGQTWRDLQRLMRAGPWHIFHFIGHGDFDTRADEGTIALADENGRTYRLSATQLGRLLDDHYSLRLVLLNSCEGALGSKHDLVSSTAATLVRRGIPAVLAMQHEISNDAAVELARAFYEAIADGLPVDAAVSEARKAINLSVPNTMEWGTPVLYMRARDGRIFDLVGTSTPLRAPVQQTMQEHLRHAAEERQWALEHKRQAQQGERQQAEEHEKPVGAPYNPAPDRIRRKEWVRALQRLIQKLRPDNPVTTSSQKQAGEALETGPEYAVTDSSSTPVQRLGQPVTPVAQPPIAPEPAHLRRFEAAMPERSFVGQPTEIRAMISMATSKGLRSRLPVRTAAGDEIKRRDVIHHDVLIEFPKNRPIELYLKVEAPDFEFQNATVALLIRPEHDSGTACFTLTPRIPRQRAIVLVGLYQDAQHMILIDSLRLATAVEERGSMSTDVPWEVQASSMQILEASSGAVYIDARRGIFGGTFAGSATGAMEGGVATLSTGPLAVSGISLADAYGFVQQTVSIYEALGAHNIADELQRIALDLQAALRHESQGGVAERQRRLDHARTELYTLVPQQPALEWLARLVRAVA